MLWSLPRGLLAAGGSFPIASNVLPPIHSHPRWFPQNWAMRPSAQLCVLSSQGVPGSTCMYSIYKEKIFNNIFSHFCTVFRIVLVSRFWPDDSDWTVHFSLLGISPRYSFPACNFLQGMALWEAYLMFSPSTWNKQRNDQNLLMPFTKLLSLHLSIHLCFRVYVCVCVRQTI